MACALGFSRSDPERRYLKVYVYSFIDLCLRYRQLKHFGRFPRQVFSFSNSLKVMGGYKSKQQEEAPSKQSTHAIYGIVTVYRAVTIYRVVTVHRAGHTTLDKKKRTILEIRGEKNAVPRVLSCSIKRDQRRASPIRDSPRLLTCADRA